MRDERRSDERFNIKLPVKWDGMAGANEAHLDDLSMGGCFVNTPSRVERGEVVTIEICLPTGTWLQLRGEVTSHQPGIGFGLSFSFLTEDEEEALRDLMSPL